MIRKVRLIVPLGAFLVALAWMNAGIRGQVKPKL